MSTSAANSQTSLRPVPDAPAWGHPSYLGVSRTPSARSTLVVRTSAPSTRPAPVSGVPRAVPTRGTTPPTPAVSGARAPCPQTDRQRSPAVRRGCRTTPPVPSLAEWGGDPAPRSDPMAPADPDQGREPKSTRGSEGVPPRSGVEEPARTKTPDESSGPPTPTKKRPADAPLTAPSQKPSDARQPTTTPGASTSILKDVLFPPSPLRLCPWVSSWDRPRSCGSWASGAPVPVLLRGRGPRDLGSSPGRGIGCPWVLGQVAVSTAPSR